MSDSDSIYRAINTVGLVLLGLLQLWNNRKVREVKEIVDGPLSLALQSNAELTAWKAGQTGSHEDIKAAAIAAAVQQNRAEGKQ